MSKEIMNTADGKENTLLDKAAGAFWGMTIGDAISYPSMKRMRFIYDDWTKRILADLSANQAEYNIDREEVPFVFSRKSEKFTMGPSSRTEWALFTSQFLIKNKGNFNLNELADYWRKELVETDLPIRSGVAEKSAIINLQRNLKPPATGKDNPHFYDDGAVTRAIPIGIISVGEPEQATEMSRKEACISHDKDGIYAAQAMAAAIATLCQGGTVEEAIIIGSKHFPEDSWIGRNWKTCQEVLDQDLGLFDLIFELDRQVVDKIYSYAHLAPQTLPVAFAIFLAAGDKSDFVKTVSIANSLSRISDSTAAFVGALSGAWLGMSKIPTHWRKKMAPVHGAFVPSVKDTKIDEIVAELVRIAEMS